MEEMDALSNLSLLLDCDCDYIPFLLLVITTSLLLPTGYQDSNHYLPCGLILVLHDLSGYVYLHSSLL